MPQVLLVNPSSHRRGKKRKARRAVRRNPVHAFTKRRKKRRSGFAGLRRYRKNPSMLGGLNLGGQVMPVALGAGGALLADIAMDKLPIPADFKIGMKRTVARGAIAVGLGFVAGKAVGRDKGMKVMAGALTVVAYEALRDLLRDKLGAPAPMAPAEPVAGMGYYPALDFEGDMGALVEDSMGNADFEDAELGELLDY